ncbi:MAG: AI-2E family transporter [Clostridia bacterium]|nr:AI-2E family transporter [Clostridia bacterium]
MDKFDKKKFKTGLLFATAVILIYATIMNFHRVGGFISAVYSVISPLLFGVVLALILGTPMAKFEQFFHFLNRKSKSKKKLPEKAITMISLILTYLLAAGAITFVIGALIPALIDSVNEIAKTVEAAMPKVIELMNKHDIDTKDLTAMLSKIDFEAILSHLTVNAGGIADAIKNSVSGFVSAIANLVTMVIFSVYLLANKKRIKSQVGRIIDAYFSEKHAPKVRSFINLTVTTFMRFFSGQCLEAIILGSIFFIVMSIFGFPYAPVISVIIGITAFIPYVGAFIGCFVGVLLILMVSPMRALIFVIMFLIIQQLENNLIYPRVVGGSIGLPAMWTFAALIIGGALYGVVGMLVFIPIASIIYTIVKSDVAARLKAKAEKKAREDAENQDETA